MIESRKRSVPGITEQTAHVPNRECTNPDCSTNALVKSITDVP